MAVKILINGIKVAKGTKYSYDKKINNDVVVTFDGPDIGEDESPIDSIKISRVVTYDPNFEKNLAAALKANIPIVISDSVNGHKFTDTCTGGYLDSFGGDKAPNKKMTEDLGFTVLKRVRKWE